MSTFFDDLEAQLQAAARAQIAAESAGRRPTKRSRVRSSARYIPVLLALGTSVLVAGLALVLIRHKQPGTPTRPSGRTAPATSGPPSSRSVAAWVRTTGPIQLVVTGPRTVHDLRRFTAVVVNNSATTYTPGGCTWWDRWPSTSVTRLSCLSAAHIAPHSRAALRTISPLQPAITRPGLYRLDFTYWPKGVKRASAMRVAFTWVRVVAPVTGQCSSSRKTCVYSR
jgi:hypothetical protein